MVHHTLPSQRLRLLRQLLKRQRLWPYYRLIALVVTGNIAIAILLAPAGISSAAMLTLTLANICLAVLIREQHLINALFRLALAVPRHWPLAARWAAAKVYHLGGIHVGAAIGGTAWLIAAALQGQPSAVNGVLVWAIAVIVIAMSIAAAPPLRERHHDWFERLHRFGGWLAITFLWVQQALARTSPQSFDYHRLLQLALTAAITIIVALPWLRLRRVPITVERVSAHAAVVTLQAELRAFPGSWMPVARHPLGQWHSFAHLPGHPHFRMVVSRAGDWTSEFIHDPPSHLWIRGIPTAGVAGVGPAFSNVVYFATGSGIGPILPHLLARLTPLRLVWITRDPRATYGDKLVDEVLDAAPGAIIWDTTTSGKPSIVELAREVIADSGAEAVICISNRPLTFSLVLSLEREGIPAMGALWDS